MKYYKFLENGESCNGGSYQWSLPTKNDDGTWTPGEWTTPVEGKLEPCENGYHLCREQDILSWLGPEMYEAEASWEVIEAEDKVITRSARLLRRVDAWNERTARLFAVWCARNALALVEEPDPRSVAAVDTAERFANGEATREELDAARDAARDAAWAASAAARDAAWDAAFADWAAAWAAWAAAWAARGVAWAARGAARDARDAARDAAWDAASAARDAARDAASAAAWDAQTKHLAEVLGL